MWTRLSKRGFFFANWEGTTDKQPRLLWFSPLLGTKLIGKNPIADEWSQFVTLSHLVSLPNKYPRWEIEDENAKG